jgi:hypothetical protein
MGACSSPLCPWRSLRESERCAHGPGTIGERSRDIGDLAWSCKPKELGGLPETTAQANFLSIDFEGHDPRFNPFGILDVWVQALTLYDFSA